MHDIASLIDDRDAMDELVDRLIVAARKRLGAPATCRVLMAEFDKRLEHYRQAMTRLLGPDADDRRASPHDREIASFREELVELCENWRCYFQRWTEDRIDADHSRHYGATTDIMTAFKLHLARHPNLLYPLVLDSRRIAFG